MIVYTDGSCLYNPGPGGWGFIAIIDNWEIHISGGEEHTTNNKMELMAVIETLKNFPNEFNITIYSDSLYVINCAKNIWKRKKNIQLWKLYDSFLNNRNIEWIKIKGHSGDKYNDLVDTLAKNQSIEINLKQNYKEIFSQKTILV